MRLNDRWRVIDDPLQWILQRRDGAEKARTDARGKSRHAWKGNAYCTTRRALLRNIRERCGDVDPAAVAFVETWPEQHAPGTVEPLVQISQEAA